MDLATIAALRLRTQRLVGEPFRSAVEAVGWLTAVQSQDYASGKWALAQRLDSTTSAHLDSLFDEGKILRTHVMRPTWHFALPADIGWLLELTAPRIRASLIGRYRNLELDSEIASRAKNAFAAALEGGRHLTRTELGQVLESIGISPAGQRLPHLLMDAELDRVVISGPRRGKQLTYALFAERVPASRRLNRDEAVAELAFRYFQSHGPAQLQDFVWWSGLTIRDARAGIAASGSAVQVASVAAEPLAGRAHLLPNWDEYTVGYRDRSALVDPEHPIDPALFSWGGSLLSNVVTIDGRVRGSWRRSGANLHLSLMRSLKPAEREAVQVAAQKMGRHLDRQLTVSVTTSA